MSPTISSHEWRERIFGGLLIPVSHIFPLPSKKIPSLFPTSLS